MTKTYDGIVDALITAENIIENNLGKSWKDLVIIFHNDPIIEPYYFEVVFIILAGRNSLRFDNTNIEDEWHFIKGDKYDSKK